MATSWTHNVWNFRVSLESGGDQGEREPGTIGGGGVQETGNARPGSGIPKVAGNGRN